MSTDEHRIVLFMDRLADRYDKAAERNPFSFHRVRAKLLRRVARAIEDGKHR